MDFTENVSCQFMLFTGYNVTHLLSMRFYFGVLVVLPLLFGPAVFSVQAQTSGTTPSLRLATRQFQAPDGAPYLEVQAEFLASSVTWLSEGDSLFRAAVKWTVIAYDSTGTVAGFVKSTSRTGSLPQKGDFVDVARMELAPGPHVLELEVEDVGAPQRPHLEYETVVEVSDSKSLDISDLFVVQGVAEASVPPGPLTRSGKDILPLVDSRVSAEASGIAFYCELYGTDIQFGSGTGFLVVAGFKMPGEQGAWAEETRRYFRMKAAPVLPVLEALPPPPAGVYELVVQIMTPEQELLVSNSTGLQCISEKAQEAAVAAGSLAPFVLLHNDRDSLLALVETLIPIADAGERRSIEYVLQGADLGQLRSFLEQFWTVRAPENPADAWRTYRTEVPSRTASTEPAPTAKVTKQIWVGFCCAMAVPIQWFSVTTAQRIIPMKSGITTRQASSTTGDSCSIRPKWWASVLSFCTATIRGSCAMQIGWTFSKHVNWGIQWWIPG